LGITVQLTRAGGAAPNPAKMQMDSPEHLQFPDFDVAIRKDVLA